MITAEEMVSAKNKGVVSVSSNSTVHEAIATMNENKIGAILVQDGDSIVGIWTERDLLRNVLTESFDPKTARISDHMVTELKFAEHDETLYRIQDRFLGMRFRHMLIRKKGTFIGLLSAGDVMKALLNEKQKELKDLNAMVSWEYYDNWRWDQKK